MTKQEAANPPYTLAAEKAAGRNGQVNGETCIGNSDILESGKIYKYVGENIARIANAVQVPICLLVSTSVY